MGSTSRTLRSGPRPPLRRIRLVARLAGSAIYISALLQLHRLKSVLPGPALENQGGVCAAEAEGIRKSVFDRGFASHVGDVVQIAFGIRGFEIDCGRQNLIAQGEDADASFEASGAA